MYFNKQNEIKLIKIENLFSLKQNTIAYIKFLYLYKTKRTRTKETMFATLHFKRDRDDNDNDKAKGKHILNLNTAEKKTKIV